MALEIRVYDEVTDVDPKVMWGMTFRQLIAVAASVVLIAGATTWLGIWLGSSPLSRGIQ